jgi:hypothetical protein
MFGIGTQELVIGAILIGVIALFGKKFIITSFKEWLGLKKELKSIKDAEELKVPNNA